MTNDDIVEKGRKSTYKVTLTRVQLFASCTFLTWSQFLLFTIVSISSVIAVTRVCYCIPIQNLFFMSFDFFKFFGHA